MIPKKIHYCWFGGKQFPALAVKCLDSWKNFLPEYEIIEWNEQNFDLNKFGFAKEAYESKKFAYVTDVCRLYALKEMGGIYMDTDVEVLKPLDCFLNDTAFSGFESNLVLPTGIMASEKEGVWVTEMLEYYENKKFLDNDNKPMLIPNTRIITESMTKKGFVIKNSFQKKEGYITFYPSDYFCPKDNVTGYIFITENTHCIHHFSGSWLSNKSKLKNKFSKLMYRIFGREIVNGLKGKLLKRAQF
jgi:hypothetical protein